MSAFVPYEPQSLPLELLYFVIDVGLLFGLVGIYVYRAQTLGAAGFAGAALALMGQAMIVGPDATLDGFNTYDAALPIIVAGLAILSIQIIRTQCYPAWIGWLWIATPVLSLGGTVAGAAEFGFLLGGTAYGMAFLGAGAALRSAAKRDVSFT